MACTGHVQYRRGVGRRVTDGGVVSAGGNAHEPVLVGGVKVHRPFIVAQRRQNARITRRVSTLDTVESPALLADGGIDRRGDATDWAAADPGP
ncbi:hypothetical protein NUJ47_08750 [Mycobacterium sp. XDR-29]|uniref:hypothetical protein n=1 Tax=Mycobacterium TaxID=1763 RepID=UPI001F1A0DF7|nr:MULTISPECIES: hypothetical protein [Mycobacterium]MDQ6430147.1 hypothetical protein [Mycobacterium sp. XDR-29]